MWRDFIDKVYLINLLKRGDRLLESVKQCEDYNIPFSRFSAIESPNGADGLRDTMSQLFDDAIKNNYSNILVLEDDFEIIVPPITFDNTVDEVCKQLPSNYWVCFLGCQLTGKIKYFHSPNVIAATKMYSTHSVIYSLQGCREIIARTIKAPIDNFYVDEIEPMNNSYCSYPILCSQRAGKSDIGGQFIDWKPFIVPRFNQQVANFKG
jgi:GR25 family glycosyltransferase involved in LPS biosynthesis